MENTHKKDKVMRSALVLLVLVAVIFAGSLIFAGKKASTPLNSDAVSRSDTRAGKSAIDLENSLSKAIINIGGNHLTASVADTELSRKNGLSNIHSIGPDEAKVFVFDKEDYHSFWMKDMNFPLDIIWVNNQNTVVDIRENIAPETYPDTFKPAYPASKTIEVNAGWVEEHNIKVGDTIMLTELQ